MDIDSRTFRSLEWDKLKDYLAAEALTDWGRQMCLAAEVHQEPLLIQTLLEETNEGLCLIQSRSSFPQESLPEVRETLQRLQAGGDLSAHQLNQLKAVQIQSRMVKASLSLLEKQTFPQLTRLLPQLHAVPELVEAVDHALDDTAQVKDQASPKLGSLRKEIQHLERQIRFELNKIIHSSTLSKALQEPLFTQRNGRWVLPVEASMRQSIPGIVHDSSASGLTVYVEPMAVVELANKVRMKESDVEHEISRILSELSAIARQHREQIQSSYRTLIELDFIMSRARLATRYNGTFPAISAQLDMNFRSARHPLLILQDPARASRVVPNDIALSKNHRTLVITGPNTGGKTVLLKTVGLLSLMVRAGLLLPVAPGSTACVFSHIRADIGDEQSLEQNLSTFSSHMTNIVEILRTSAKGSLVLLDEIGAGTDPREGAALARAILERLNDSGAATITTTHYGSLKVLAYTREGFLNASLDFDEETLSPTYKLRVGVPGSSKAITIASRLGLHEDVAAAASQLIESDANDVQSVIERLEEKLKQAAELQEQAASAQQAARKLEADYRARLEALQNQQEDKRSAYIRQIEQEFEAARELVRELTARLQKEPSSRAARQAQQQMETIRTQLNWLSTEQVQSGNKTIASGQKVRVRSLNQIGWVEDVPPQIGKEGALLTVRCGTMKVKVPLSDVEPAAAQTSGKPAKSQPSGQGPFSKSSKPAEAHGQFKGSSEAPVFVRSQGNTLDLRGQRVDEAVSNLERFVDSAVVDGTSPIMIIHGHGTGAIKSVVRDFLGNSDYAKKFRPGENYEGGDGVTIVDL